MRCMVVTLLMLAASIACPVFANDYPNKPIKIISDSAPGSAVDVTFRMVMDRLGICAGPADYTGRSAGRGWSNCGTCRIRIDP